MENEAYDFSFTSISFADVKEFAELAYTLHCQENLDNETTAFLRTIRDIRVKYKVSLKTAKDWAEKVRK